MALIDSWTSYVGPLSAVVGAGGFALANRWARRRIDISLEMRELELKRALDQEFAGATSMDRQEIQQLLRELSQQETSGGGDPRPTSRELARALDEVYERVERLEKVDRSLGVRSTALLELYHRQGLSQSRISFWFSLFLGALGLGVILYALLTGSQAWATFVSGAVTEAVSALIFTQSTQARKVMSEFFDGARDDRRLEEALGLADRMTDQPLRSALQAVLALELVGAKTAASVLPGLQQVRNDTGGDKDRPQ